MESNLKTWRAGSEEEGNGLQIVGKRFSPDNNRDGPIEQYQDKRSQAKDDQDKLHGSISLSLNIPGLLWL